MQLEWDEDKRQQLIAERGIDLLYAALIFERETLTKEDTRKAYGETRYISLGLVADEAFVVVHTRREGRTRLITAWKGGKRSYEKYKERLP